jgi:hypothetical protein
MLQNTHAAKIVRSIPHGRNIKNIAKIFTGLFARYVDNSKAGSFSTTVYSTLLHLPPLRFHCVEGCWGIVAISALAVRHYNHSAKSHPL